MPTIYSLRFDAQNWPKIKEAPHQLIWQPAPSDTVSLELKRPTDFQRDLRDPQARLEFDQMAVQNGGALIEFEVTQLQDLEVAMQVYKFWHPTPQDMRKVYVSTLAFPFAEFCYILKAQCLETGTTGVREATVALSLSNTEMTPPTDEPVLVQSPKELFERVKKAPLTSSPSDDPRYDAQFPDHPLTKVRGYLKHFAASLSVDPSLQAAKPYRIRSTSPSLLAKVWSLFKKG